MRHTSRSARPHRLFAPGWPPALRRAVGCGLLATLAALSAHAPARAACAAAAEAAGDTAAQATPEAAMDTALWPADVLRAAESVMRQPADDAQGLKARAVHAGAAEAVAALQRRDVKLQRSAFCADRLDPNPLPLAELRAAARGDGAAAHRIARLLRTQQPDALHRYEGWLQFAAALGHEQAAYELALHYRRVGQPIYAAVYEARAVERGFIVPVALDNVRK